jgi:hypothetical protein
VFLIAEAEMRDLWQKDADVVIEPDIDGFAFGFDRAKELIANGEKAAGAALPQMRRLLHLPEPRGHTRHNRGLRGAVERPSGTPKLQRIRYLRADISWRQNRLSCGSAAPVAQRLWEIHIPCCNRNWRESPQRTNLLQPGTSHSWDA